MIPIEKNITVVDEQGNEYEATYPKRAKGLVKNGRARFITENKICLACPPNKINFLEDKKMNNDLLIDNKESIGELEPLETLETAVNETEQKPTGYIPKLSMEYVLSRIDAILNDTDHIHEAIKAIPEIPVMMPNEGMMNYQGDFAGQSKADAISHAVQSRETTNQQLIRLLEKMYDDLKPKEIPEDILKIKELREALSGLGLPSEYIATILEKSAKQMFIKPGAGIAISS